MTGTPNFKYQDLQNRIEELEAELEQVRDARTSITSLTYQELVKHAPICIHDIDLEGRLMTMNPAGLAMVGMQEEEIRGVPYIEFIARDQRESVRALLKRALAGETISEFLFTVKTDEGIKTFQSNFIPILSDKGDVQKLMGVTSDITDRIRAAESLLKAKTEAEQANQAKSELLANVSHELRTPMNGVLGVAELFKMQDLSDELRPLATVLHDSAKVMVGLIDDLLDLSTLDVEQMTLQKKPFNPAELLEAVHTNFDGFAREQGLVLETTMRKPLPTSLIGDSGRIGQILNNLVGNALKFTLEGKITVTTDWMALPDSVVSLIVEVSDTGIGISEDGQKAIFDSFKQLDMSSCKTHQGVGLGLSICKKLCELMHGRLSVESAPGKGSTFHFAIPLQMDTSQSQQDRTLISKEFERNYQKRILLAEDNPLNQVVAVRMLEKLGCEVSLAEDGRQAVQLYQPGAFDLILMDLQMPGYDGFVAARKLLEMHESSLPPVLAYTASSTGCVLKKKEQFGMQGVLAKPLKIAELVNTLDQHFGSSQART